MQNEVLIFLHKHMSSQTKEESGTNETRQFGWWPEQGEAQVANMLWTCKHAAHVQGEEAAAINHFLCENILKLQHQPLYLRDKLPRFFSLPQTLSQTQRKMKDNKKKSIWEAIYFYQPGPLGHSSCNFSSAPFPFLESSHLGTKISNFSNCLKNWQLLSFLKSQIQCLAKS